MSSDKRHKTKRRNVKTTTVFKPTGKVTAQGLPAMEGHSVRSPRLNFKTNKKRTQGASRTGVNKTKRR